jgi:hypothetical protein
MDRPADRLEAADGFALGIDRELASVVPTNAQRTSCPAGSWALLLGNSMSIAALFAQPSLPDCSGIAQAGRGDHVPARYVGAHAVQSYEDERPPSVRCR